ncbi:hypothetical protein VOLCADRAFT_89014 [Volvox carteri f. nagariensis]|uniref:Rieske domain-containing protein n=1 Tax=Volvox carteri f. nagariensis TaxID=3068 RepID=D8TQK1_VOLCA|nr:uncharacterized protein VOLCADRAFT_89014 [Volvox carteri f. nagariensis]EFJ50047.1 hypothetical protein VOLCADRAFT_89014 [Volvox carteri f. nagariensis]|eukprot:XP_002948667.1 hypothetical protein VOLCADRAFT_89014 [Volvox carteri f. nagariensis]
MPITVCGRSDMRARMTKCVGMHRLATRILSFSGSSGSATRSSGNTPSLEGRSPGAVAAAAAVATMTSTSSSLTAPEAAKPTPAPGVNQPKPDFVWTRHWWPLIPVDYLKPDRPNPVTLLGITMVVWRDAGGRWRVFRDRCPHRLAPLSEGRVESDGSLSCAYHGWRFDGSGACRRIPQAVDAASEAAACSSRRSCATAYPARVEFNMLWVWPDASPDAEAAAAATELVVSNDLRRRDNPGGTNFSWFMRDLPYSYEILLENLTDPSHLPFSHHGHSPALARDKGGAMPMKPSQDVTTAAAGAESPTPPPQWARPDGPDFEFDFRGNISPDATISVHMPHQVMYTYRLGPQFQIRMELFAVPVAPGRSRFFSFYSRIPIRFSPQKLLTGGVVQAAKYLLYVWDPVVLSHLSTHEILDGDSVFLSVQDEVVQEAEERAAITATVPGGDPVVTAKDAAAAAANGGGAARSASTLLSRLYYMPAQADAAVQAGRRWIEERAGGAPFRARQQQLLAGRAATIGAATDISGSAETLTTGGLVGLLAADKVPGEAPDPQRRRHLLSRYEQHTRHCPSCSKRLQQLQQMVAAAAAVQKICLLGMCVAGGALSAVLAVAAAAAAAPAAVPWALPAAALAGSAALWAVAGGLAAAAETVSKMFIFQDHVHADKN